MFDNILKIFKKFAKEEKKDTKTVAKERLHLVLMQDRANVSADFMELMKQEIIEVIKKYIDVDENSIDVKLTNKVNSDGTTGAPILYANIPILNVKDDTKQINTDGNSKKEEMEGQKANKAQNEMKVKQVEGSKNDNENKKVEINSKEKDKEQKIQEPEIKKMEQNEVAHSKVKVSESPKGKNF